LATTHEPCSIDVGSKLLLVAILLMVFGVLATILMPVMSMMAPGATPASVIGAVVPGIAMLLGGIVFGVIAGIFLSYAKRKYPDL